MLSNFVLLTEQFFLNFDYFFLKKKKLVLYICKSITFPFQTPKQLILKLFISFSVKTLNMKKNNLLLFFSFAAFFFLQMTQTSCTNDKLVENTVNPACETIQASYDNQVKAIINNSCATAGCHAPSSPLGDYSSYSGMNNILNDNKFKKRVLELQDMPPSTDLTPEELEILECWAAGEYPEN